MLTKFNDNMMLEKCQYSQNIAQEKKINKWMFLSKTNGMKNKVQNSRFYCKWGFTTYKDPNRLKFKEN